MKKTNEKTGNMRRAGMAVLVSMGVLLLAGCGAETVNLNDYVTVKYSGINTKGEAGIDDRAVEAAIEEIVFKKAKKGSDIDGTVNSVKEAYRLELDKEEGLSNGDEVKVTAVINNELSKSEKIKFTFIEFSDTVNGLEEVPVYTDDDLFAGIKVSFKGISPNVEADMRNDTDNADIKSMQYHISAWKELKAGDTVTVTLDVKDTDRYLIDENAALAKDFTVEGVAEYIGMEEQLTDEVKQKAMPVVVDKIDARINDPMWAVQVNEDNRYNNYRMTTYDNLNVSKILLLTPKEGEHAYNQAYNHIFYVYTFDAHSDSRNSFSADTDFTGLTVAGVMDNVYINEDGTIETVLNEDVELTGFYRDYDSWYRYEVNEYQDKFNITEIAAGMVTG